MASFHASRLVVAAAALFLAGSVVAQVTDTTKPSTATDKAAATKKAPAAATKAAPAGKRLDFAPTAPAPAAKGVSPAAVQPAPGGSKQYESDCHSSRQSDA